MSMEPGLKRSEIQSKLFCFQNYQDWCCYSAYQRRGLATSGSLKQLSENFSPVAPVNAVDKACKAIASSRRARSNIYHASALWLPLQTLETDRLNFKGCPMNIHDEHLWWTFMMRFKMAPFFWNAYRHFRSWWLSLFNQILARISAVRLFYTCHLGCKNLSFSSKFF